MRCCSAHVGVLMFTKELLESKDLQLSILDAQRNKWAKFLHYQWLLYLEDRRNEWRKISGCDARSKSKEEDLIDRDLRDRWTRGIGKKRRSSRIWRLRRFWVAFRSGEWKRNTVHGLETRTTANEWYKILILCFCAIFSLDEKIFVPRGEVPTIWSCEACDFCNRFVAHNQSVTCAS